MKVIRVREKELIIWFNVEEFGEECRIGKSEGAEMQTPNGKVRKELYSGRKQKESGEMKGVDESMKTLRLNHDRHDELITIDCSNFHHTESTFYKTT